MDSAVAALAGYARLMLTLETPLYRAVATSAVRESRNGREFTDRVAAETGLLVEAITGAEEARLVHLAVRDRVALGTGRWLLVDLGGGSVEVSLVDRKRIRWSVSHDMGSVRMLEELSVAGDDATKFRTRIEEYTSNLRLPVRYRRVAGFIATGGNIEALARLSGCEPDRTGVSVLPLAALSETIEGLVRLATEERMSKLDLRADRADVIVPAALVYEHLCRLAGFESIVVPNAGVKEGVLLDVVDYATRHRSHDARLEQVVYHGALMLGRRYRFEQAHARHVMSLALSLFDQLKELHDLSPADRRILTAAALLHDIGTFVNYRKHHKHSLYLIAQAELPGFTQREMQLIANVARYHRKSEPAPHHDAYMALTDTERTRVRGLAALLRIADALDREHTQTVSGIAARADGGTVKLRVTGRGDMLLERWSLERKCGLFEKSFDRRIDLSCERID